MSELQLPWVVELKAANDARNRSGRSLRRRLVIGRTDKAANVKPDIDLTPYNAESLRDFAPARRAARRSRRS